MLDFGFAAGSRDANLTEQMFAANMSAMDDDDALSVTSAQQLACGAGRMACGAANESMANVSYSDLDSPLGLEDVTAVASNYTLGQTIVLGLLAGSTSLITIAGNLVVFLSFILERSIRQPSNYFIASLAVSDMLIGSISMPFYTVYLLSGKYWPLGDVLCDLWLSLDYTVCLSSIYTVFCITVDRFCSVQIPAKYRNWRTERKVLTAICVIWVVPILVFFTSIIGWQYFVGERRVEEGMCYVQYMEDAVFNFLLQFGYFWITLTAMCSLYAGIYRVALRLQRQAEAKHQRRAAMLLSVAGSTQQQHQGTVLTEAIDQHNMSQHIGSTAADGGQQHPETGNNVAEVQLPPVTSTWTNSNRKEHRRRLHSKRSNKRHQQHEHNDDDDDDQSSSFAFSSDSERGDVEKTGSCGAPARQTSVTGAGQRPKACGGRGSKSRRRVTRYKSPIVAVERAAQFIADQHGTADDVRRSEIEMPTSVRNISQPRTPATADQACTSFDAVPTGCGFAVETPVSRCQLDHQCVFEAWRRPRPRLSPVWVRRQVGGPCRQRGDCDDGRTDLVRSVSATHVVVLDDQDGPVTCGCNNLPLALAGVNCLSTRSPDVAASGTADHRGPASAAAECTAARKDRSGQRRASGTRRSATDQRRRKQFVLVTALHRLSQARRWRRGDDTVEGTSTTTTTTTAAAAAVPRTGRSENRARKALRTITIILGAFVLCWTPWHVLSMIMGFCFPCVEPVIYDISYWLCYLNSPINPLCYAFANQQFKKTFLRIIRGDWHRT